MLNKWKEKKTIISELNSDKKNDLIGILVAFFVDNEITITQSQNACKFVNTCSDEMIVNFMNMVMETRHLDNIRKIHKILGNKIVKIVSAANDV